MPKIAVFDSGFGSLSIIRPIQKKIVAEIIYFADQKHYPYGTKTVRQLNRIIKTTISTLQKKFNPDAIVVASNTPSLLLNLTGKKIILVVPPLKEASRITKTNVIGILATKSVVNSKALDKYIEKNLSKKIQVIKINATPLVDLVESGKFITERKLSKSIIKKNMTRHIAKDVDVVILSSTHLPFLIPLLKESFPHVKFLDPAYSIPDKILKVLKDNTLKRSKFKIFASGNVITFQKRLLKIGIKNRVQQL